MRVVVLAGGDPVRPHPRKEVLEHRDACHLCCHIGAKPDKRGNPSANAPTDDLGHPAPPLSFPSVMQFAPRGAVSADGRSRTP
jgi:hypothetical protein